MLDWSIAALRAAGVGEIIVAMPAQVTAGDGGVLLVSGAPLTGRGGEPYRLPPGVHTVQGGRERSHSVQAAFDVATGDPLIVHDGARPLVTPELISLSVAALDADPSLAAAIAAAPVTDTIKRSPGGAHVEGTLDRSELWAVQTPQVFRREWLQRALTAPDHVIAGATDDASLVEALGGTVGLVRSGPENLKVTTRHDLRVAELLLSE